MKRRFLRKFGLTLVAMVLMIFSADSALASGFAITEKSVKGLGNAFAGAAAVAEDASTIFFNPAGMTRLTGRQVQAGGYYIIPSFEFDDDGSTTVIGTPLTGGDGGDAGESAFVANFFYAHSLTEDLKIGVGVVSPFGLATKYNSDWVGRYHGIRSEILTIDINPSIAYKIHPMLSIGAGLSAQYVDAELTQAVDYGTINAVGRFGLPIAPQGADGRAKLTADDWGVGYNLGLLFEPTKSTRFGVAYRSKISLGLTGDAEFNTPAAAAPLAAALGNVDTDVEADIDLPASLLVTAYHQLTDKWAILADVTWTEWSELEELRIEFDSGAADSVTTFDWDDALRYSVGAIYKFSAQWTFRGGVALDQTPVPGRKDRGVRIPDDDRLWLSVGTSYEFLTGLGVDFAYSYINQFGDAKIEKTAAGEDTFRGALNGDFEGGAHIIGLQVSYKF